VSDTLRAAWHDAAVEISPFDPSQADVIAAWPVDEAECLAWCSAGSVAGVDVAAWSSDDAVEAWVVADDGGPVAYGEIWFDDDEQEVELAHLIVAPARRGAELGRHLVEALAARGAERYATVVMRVAPDNESARRCYAAAGFVRVSASEEAEWNTGQPRAYVWMRR
jgi:ribosomal protein S18 acetylase RimI-like enzyme